MILCSAGVHSMPSTSWRGRADSISPSPAKISLMWSSKPGALNAGWLIPLADEGAEFVALQTDPSDPASQVLDRHDVRGAHHQRMDDEIGQTHRPNSSWTMSRRASASL